MILFKCSCGMDFKVFEKSIVERNKKYFECPNCGKVLPSDATTNLTNFIKAEKNDMEVYILPDSAVTEIRL